MADWILRNSRKAGRPHLYLLLLLFLIPLGIINRFHLKITHKLLFTLIGVLKVLPLWCDCWYLCGVARLETGKQYTMLHRDVLKQVCLNHQLVNRLGRRYISNSQLVRDKLNKWFLLWIFFFLQKNSFTHFGAWPYILDFLTIAHLTRRNSVDIQLDYTSHISFSIFRKIKVP